MSGCKSLIIIVLLCLSLCFVSSKESTDDTTINDIRVKISKVLEPLNDEVFDDKDFNQSAAICECGENSVGCSFVNGIKRCKCKPGFAAGQYGICVETCNETKKCHHGGSCLQHVCVCLPGTSGPFCETIDDCKNNRLCAENDGTSCQYDEVRQKAYCRCSTIEWRFDEITGTCRECECTSWYYKNPKAWSYCEYQQGEKVCTCTKDYAYNPDQQICTDCNCGSNSKWCEFNKNGDKICGCEEGYIARGSECEKCDCGKHGLCTFSTSLFRYIDCICDSGYEQYNQTCMECSCGKYGKCIFNNDGKQIGCECLKGYSDKSGKCEMCYCGENTNCSFRGYQKVCSCAEGYENINGFCVDINECEKHNPCNASTICINTLGSYECLCAAGYSPKIIQSGDGSIATCEDIDECENLTSCQQPNTECVNTLGSFACICKSGMVSRGGINPNKLCEKTSDSSIYTVVIATSFIVLIAVVGVILYAKRNLRSRSSSNFHELQRGVVYKH